MALADGALDVLRIVVAAADDDQVLEPAADEQLAVLQKAQVAGAQERPFAGVFQMGAGTYARFRPAGSNSPGPRWGRPPKSSPTWSAGTRVRVCGIGDHQPLVEQVAAAAHQLAGTGFVGATRRAPGCFPTPRRRTSGPPAGPILKPPVMISVASAMP